MICLENDNDNRNIKGILKLFRVLLSDYISTDRKTEDLVQSVEGTIVECNMAYNGSRAETEMHRQVIKGHIFTEIANVDIMDENGDMAMRR